jgi:hypothetical protein
VDAVMTLPVSTDDGRSLSVLAVVMVVVTEQPTQPATGINMNSKDMTSIFSSKDITPISSNFTTGNKIYFEYWPLLLEISNG